MQRFNEEDKQPVSLESTQIDFHISLLQHLKKSMNPQQKHFDLIEIFQILYEFCKSIPNQTFQAQANQNYQNAVKQLKNKKLKNQANNILKQPQSPKKIKSTILQIPNEQKVFVQKYIQEKKLRLALQELQKLKSIFLYFQTSTLSYELINDYMMNNQMKILKNVLDLQNKASYINFSDQRVRLDENVKLCIMPQGDSTKIKSIAVDYQTSIAQNKKEDNMIYSKKNSKQEIFYNERIFVITNEYMRKIQINASKLHASQFYKKKSNPYSLQYKNQEKQQISQDKWYKFGQNKIIPKTIEVQSDLKINSVKQTIIESISISSTLVGIITHDREFLIQPQIQKNSEKAKLSKQTILNQIKVGNLIYDIPDQNLAKPIRNDSIKFKQIKQSKIILFQNYDDDLWIVANQHFIYVYRLPLPNSKQYVNDSTLKSTLLTLCQPLPALGSKAVLLSKDYMAIMLQSPCVIILKLQLSGKPQLWQKNRIYPTNKIYNDIQLICMSYHPIEKYLIFTDFGGYIIRLKFNITNGDLQRQGKVYDQKMGKFLTANTTNTKREKQFSLIQNKVSQSIQGELLSQKKQSQLPISQTKKNCSQNLTIWNNKGSSFVVDSKEFQFNLVQIKNKQVKVQQKPKDRSGLSIYAKPQNTQFIKIVKNNSRQNMILMTLNKNFSTVVTYQQVSKNSLNHSIFQNQKDSLYDKTIKIWDINNLTIYQSFKLSLQVAQMSLQFNGLYIVTKQKGYLGFYPFLNKGIIEQSNKKVISGINKNSSLIQQLEPHPTFGLKLVLQENQMYFTTQLQSTKNKQKFSKQYFDQNLHNFNSHITSIYKITLNNQPKLSQIQQIPQKLMEFTIKNKLYVLSDINGDKRYNCHIYNKLGIKQAIQKAHKFSNFNNVKKIKHSQFNVLFWNNNSLKFLGDNLEQSLIVYWGNSQRKLKRYNQYESISISSIQSKQRKTIQSIFIGDTICGILQKIQFRGKFQNEICFFNLNSGRIKYQITKIPVQAQICYLHSNLFICKQNFKKRNANLNDQEIDQQILQQQIYQRNRSASILSQQTVKSQIQSCIVDSEQYQHVNLYDLKSPNQRKCIYCLKYKKSFQQQKSIQQVNRYHNFNPLLGNIKFLTRKIITMKSANLYFTKEQTELILTCLFQIKIKQIKKNKNNNKQTVLNTKTTYILYSREIISEIQKQSTYRPKSEAMIISKLSNKHNLQYVCQVQSQQRVLGHWEITFQQLKKRSNITNWNYKDNLHYNKQLSIATATFDLTQIFQSFKSISKIKTKQNQAFSQFQIQQFRQISDQNFQLQWISNQISSNQSFISFAKKDRILLFSLKIDFSKNREHKNVFQSIQQIGQIILLNEKPYIKQWNSLFQKQTSNIWEKTKKQLIQLVKPKKTQQKQSFIQKQLKQQQLCINVIQNAIKQNIVAEKQITIPREIEMQKIQQCLNKEQQNKQTTPDQMNAMFRQWQIAKQIQKEKALYEKRNLSKRNQLEKYIKIVNSDPEVKQKRIKQLLSIPSIIKKPKIKLGIDLVGKTLQEVIKQHNIFSIFANKFQNYTKPEQNKLIKYEEQLNKKLQNSIQKNKNDKMNSYLVSQFNVNYESKTINILNKIAKSCSKDQNRKLNSSITHSSFQKSLLLKKKASTSLSKSRINQQSKFSSKYSLNSSSLIESQLNKQIQSNNNLQYSSSSINLKSRFKKNEKSQKLVSTNPQQSPLKLQSIPEAKQYRQNKYKRSHTQTIQYSQISAKKALQESQLKIKSSILPKINENREKLLYKMKQKKSFIKLVNERLDKSSSDSGYFQEMKKLHKKNSQKIKLQNIS